MGKSKGQERRRYVRVGTTLAIRAHMKDEVVSYDAGFVRDISTGGLGVELTASSPAHCQKLIGASAPVEFELLPPSGDPIRVVAEKAWSVTEGKGDDRRSRAGFRFVEIDESQRSLLADFVKAKADEVARQQYGKRG